MSRLHEAPWIVKAGVATAGTLLLAGCISGKGSHNNAPSPSTSKSRAEVSTSAIPKPLPSTSEAATEIPSCSPAQLDAAIPEFKSAVYRYETNDFASLTPTQLGVEADTAIADISRESVVLNDAGYSTFVHAHKNGYFLQQIIAGKGLHVAYVYTPQKQPKCSAYSLDIDVSSGNTKGLKVDVAAMGRFSLSATDITATKIDGSFVTRHEAADVNVIADAAVSELPAVTHSTPSATPAITA